MSKITKREITHLEKELFKSKAQAELVDSRRGPFTDIPAVLPNVFVAPADKLSELQIFQQRLDRALDARQPTPPIVFDHAILPATRGEEFVLGFVANTADTSRLDELIKDIENYKY